MRRSATLFLPSCEHSTLNFYPDAFAQSRGLPCVDDNNRRHTGSSRQGASHDIFFVPSWCCPSSLIGGWFRLGLWRPLVLYISWRLFYVVLLISLNILPLVFFVLSQWYISREAVFKADLFFEVQIRHGFFFYKKTKVLVFFSKIGSGRFKRK